MGFKIESHSFSLMRGLLHSRNSKKYIFNLLALNRNYSKESKFTNYNWAALIRQFTLISREHLTPEIQLHLITPNCNLWSENETKSPFNDPFWAFYWPGGQALSRYILDNPSLVQNKTVLDFGCGSGACAIAAAMSNAKTVVANDIDEIACIATELNAEINNVHVQTNSSNLIGQVIPWECILLGDMFYDEEFALELFTWLHHLHKLGKIILIGDAGRLALKKLFKSEKLKSVTKIQLPLNVKAENNGFSTAEVWSL